MGEYGRESGARTLQMKQFEINASHLTSFESHLESVHSVKGNNTMLRWT